MSTLLHLSDLHFGDADAWERQTDDKAGIVPADENSRLAVVEATLAAIKQDLESRSEKLDALIVSGDVTSRHDAKGFTRFNEILDRAGLASPSQTIVVPGNHDVDWSADPGTDEKYKRFLDATRARRMRTPLCDGIDGDSYALSDPPASPVLWLDDAVVVSINSANWCGVRLPETKLGQRRFTARLRERIAPTEASPTYDLARVSGAQLDRLTQAIRAEKVGHRVRIAVLHHHLLPVTEDEEVKPFESFTNLARLRAWLRDHHFQVVLHGHKHRSVITWDHIYEYATPDRDPSRVAIISAPSPTSWGSPVARLIKIGAATGRNPVPHAPRVVIDTVIAERPERPISVETTTLSLDTPDRSTRSYLALEAETADAVYEHLVDALEAQQGTLFNVTCVVRNPASADSPPTNFSGVNQPKAWLRDAVDWWQQPAPALVASGDAPFNHGERLYTTGNREGALDIAARKLGSTKAMALVLRDAELRAGSEAPSFVAVQLVVVSDDSGRRLDCVGYFRKQDLTLWWPVNVGELRAIQKYVLDLETSKGLREGHLVTIAAEAIHDNVLPELAGTAVDRAVDLRPEQLMQMAYQAAHAREPEVEEVLMLWKRTLEDIGDGHDFPSLGIERLIEHLTVFRDAGELPDLDLIIKRLQAVYDRAHRAKQESKRQSERDEFSTQLFRQVTEVLDAVEDAIRKRRLPDCPDGVTS